MRVKDIISATCAMGAGLIGFNAASKFKGNQKYLITKILTTAGAFGIADMLADRVSDHIDQQVDDVIDACEELLGIVKEDESNDKADNVIDITAARAEEKS